VIFFKSIIKAKIKKKRREKTLNNSTDFEILDTNFVTDLCVGQFTCYKPQTDLILRDKKPMIEI
jgi:hypothetical protein